MSNQIQNPKHKTNLTFNHLKFIWHLDFGLWHYWLSLLALAAASFGLYYPTMSRGIYLEDSAEFVTASHTLSIAHPSGYPLYLLTTKLISLIPFLPTIVERVNFVSLFWAVLSILGLYFCLVRLYKKTIAWSLSLLFAITPLAWQQATYAEVYSLNTFFLVLLFWLYLRYHEQPTNKRLYLLIFTYGLSLTNHYLPLVLMPLIVALSLRGRSPQATDEAILTAHRTSLTKKITLNALSGLLRFTRNNIKSTRHPELVEGSHGLSPRFFTEFIPFRVFRMTFLKLAGFFLLGLLPYLYIPIRAAMHPAFSWFNGDITKMLSYNIAYGHQISGSTLRYFFDVIQTLVQSFGWLGLSLALGGALFMAMHKYYLRHLVIIGSLLFGVVMTIALVGGQGYTVFASQFYKTLHVPILLIAIISIGYFLQQAYDRGYKYKLYYPLLFLLFLLPAINLGDTFIQNDRSNYVFLGNYSRQLLLSLPEKATLFVHHDHIMNDALIFSFAYQKFVQNLRPDITIYSLTPVFPPPADFSIQDLKKAGEKKLPVLENYLKNNPDRFGNYFTTWPREKNMANNFIYSPDNLYLPATNDNLYAKSLLSKYYYDQALKLFSQNKFKSGQWFLVQAIQYDPEEFSDYYYRVTGLRDTYLKH